MAEDSWLAVLHLTASVGQVAWNMVLGQNNDKNYLL
jgi:hypothetical protein